MDKLFTIEEATSLLARVREVVKSIQVAKHEIDEARQIYAQLDASHAHGNGYELKREQLAVRITQGKNKIQAELETLEQIGCELKDVDMGLIDFPSLRNGQVINLCWKIDEEAILYWHTLDTGFGSRKLL